MGDTICITWLTKCLHALSGESEAKVRQLFQEAATLAPCIIFIGPLSLPLYLSQTMCIESEMVC